MRTLKICLSFGHTGNFVMHQRPGRMADLHMVWQAMGLDPRRQIDLAIEVYSSRCWEPKAPTLACPVLMPMRM